MDKERFPRDKVCGGWITPQVLQELEVDPHIYSGQHVLQPITGFRAGRIDGREIEIQYGRAVSFGVRRCEFDHYLLQRSGARLFVGATLSDLRRSGGDWIVNGQIRTPLVVGAGGHFCPVARFLGARLAAEPVVAAQEVEFSLDDSQQEHCRIDRTVPELFFCRDLKGYGWCFRKQNFLNVGLGRLGNQGLSSHVTAFVHFLKSRGKIPAEVSFRLHGHAYLLYGYSNRQVVDNGLLLVGDAAGLAYAQSGEGILPAVESGLLAAETILNAACRYRRENLEPYRQRLAMRFGRTLQDRTGSLARCVPQWLVSWLGGALLAWPWFLRSVVLERWFLHSNQPVMVAS